MNTNYYNLFIMCNYVLIYLSITIILSHPKLLITTRLSNIIAYYYICMGSIIASLGVYLHYKN